MFAFHGSGDGNDASTSWGGHEEEKEGGNSRA